MIPFPLQEAPQSLFYWVDKLRALLPAAGCALGSAFRFVVILTTPCLPSVPYFVSIPVAVLKVK